MGILPLVSPDGRSTAAVSTFGARVLRWNCRSRERIFVPALLEHDERAAPHGGVPVLHPQFGLFGPGRKHGVVRDREWEVEDRQPDTVELKLRLDAAEVAAAAYEVRLRVALSDTGLAMELAVTNTGNDPAEFTCGLHTYLRVEDIAEATLQGLEATAYLDALDDLALKPAASVALSSPIDVNRVYVEAPSRLRLADQAASLAITQSGFGDTVVWNPGASNPQEFADLAGDEWRRFLCVEAAQIKPPVQLAAGASWRGSQHLEALDV